MNGLWRGMWCLWLAGAVACAAPPGPAGPPAVLDLGHPLTAADPTWDGSPTFTRSVLATLATAGYEAGRFATDEHFGTHVDAPSHFAEGRWTVDEIPAERLVGPGVTIDVRGFVERDVDYRVSAEDIRTFEREHGTIESGSIVLVATGWDERWTRGTAYMNVQDGVKHFPGLSVEATRLLAVERQVAAIGVDTPSIDHGPSTDFEAHRVSLSHNVYHIENAANLTRLPARGFTVVVAPVGVVGGSGAPARVLALVPR